jgi:Caspase domain
VLVIGINDYASHDVYDLDGAVADALAFKRYLEDDLGVPTSQIRLLLNAEATRSAIIGALDKLATDKRIKPGDPIIFYYAGHGGEVDAPKNWEAGGAKIQMLIPHDFRTTVNGEVLHGIPDRTIGVLLSRVAEKKGNNIVSLHEPLINEYATDRLTPCTDGDLRLLSLWIWHACCWIDSRSESAGR